MIKFMPLGNQIVVEMDAEKEKTTAGIYLPQNNEKVSKPITGKVIAVGKGKTLTNGTKLEMEVNMGDKILFGKYAGSEVQLDDVTYYIMSEDDVMAVIDDDKTVDTIGAI